MVAPGRRGENRTTRTVRGTLVSSTLLVAIGLAVVVVVALNMRHFTTLCDSETAQDEAMNRAAMERRIRTLENEIIQNSVLMTKLLSGLDAAFDVSSLLSVEELKLLAQTEAADIGQRRARQPPPPMSDYARARVAQAVGGGQLQGLIEASILPEGSSLSEFGESLAGANQGWDWGPQSSISDDFLGSNKVESVALPKWDVTDKERETLCNKWMADFGVTPGADWGTLPETERRKWVEYRCDEMSGVVGAITTFGGTRPPPKGRAAEEIVPAAAEKRPREDSYEGEDLAGDDGGAVEHREGWDSGEAEDREGGGARARARRLADGADVRQGHSGGGASGDAVEKSRRNR